MTFLSICSGGGGILQHHDVPVGPGTLSYRYAGGGAHEGVGERPGGGPGTRPARPLADTDVGAGRREGDPTPRADMARR